MLEQKDLQAIAELIDARITKTEEKVERLETRISNVETNLANLANELVRTEDKLCRRIGRVEKSIEEFKGYFRLEKKENEGVDLTIHLRKVVNS